MTVTLKTVDQVPGVPTLEGPRLTFQVETVTVREIVRGRVRIEVERYNSGLQTHSLIHLVEPSKDEKTLNGPRRERPRTLDVEAQTRLALEAVQAGRVIVLFNGQQVRDVDMPLLVTPVSEARFLRLVPLVGG